MRQGQELTHVRRFLAAARVCVRASSAALLAGGSSVPGAFANLQLVSSVPGELTISWDLRPHARLNGDTASEVPLAVVRGQDGTTVPGSIRSERC